MDSQNIDTKIASIEKDKMLDQTQPMAASINESEQKERDEYDKLMKEVRLFKQQY